MELLVSHKGHAQGNEKFIESLRTESVAALSMILFLWRFSQYYEIHLRSNKGTYTAQSNLAGGTCKRPSTRIRHPIGSETQQHSRPTCNSSKEFTHYGSKKDTTSAISCKLYYDYIQQQSHNKTAREGNTMQIH
eukprot:12760087-Ditylum_brightwellii.AAC.1